MSGSTQSPMPTDPNRSNRYQVDQLGNGFDLHGMPNRPLIRVRMSQTCWLIEAACSNDESGEPMRDLPPLGFFERFTLTRRIAELSMRSWQPRAAPPLAALRLRSWAVNQASRSIGYIVKLESERLLRSVNPTILSVQRSVFKIGLGACSLSLHPSFYQCASPFLISDLTRYRAAASAMLILSEALATPCHETTDSAVTVVPPHGQDEEMVRRITCRMEQWRACFSDTQQTYKALNLTLDNLPGGIPANLLNSLSRVHLCRPISDRLELMLLLFAIEEGLPQPQLQRLQFTHRREILHAMSFASEKTGLRLSPRKSVDVGRFARLLRELSEPSTKALLGLTRQALQRKGERERSHLVDERRVQTPPISPPDLPGLTFLGTVGEIHQAAKDFKNCLASRGLISAILISSKKAIASRKVTLPFWKHFAAQGSITTKETSDSPINPPKQYERSFHFNRNTLRDPNDAP